MFQEKTYVTLTSPQLVWTWRYNDGRKEDDIAD